MSDLANTAFRDAESAHWYSRDGEPQHTVVAKSSGVNRPTTLRDARKLGLLPSVTTILGCWNEPTLNQWKQRTGVLSAVTLPRNASETEESFVARVVEDSNRQAKEAAENGTRGHDLFYQVNTQQAGFSAPPPELMLAVEAYEAWYAANIVRTVAAETVLVDMNAGVAGTCDLIAEHQAYGRIYVDYKFKIQLKGKPAWYPKYCEQLAAYRKADKIGGSCLSMVVDCSTGELHEHLWPEDQLERGYDAFYHLAKAWQAKKGYYPNE